MDSTKAKHSEDAQALYSQSDLLIKGRFSKSHLYNLQARGHFPRPVLVLGSRFTRWSATECDQWFSDPAGWIEAHKGSAL
jgi:predicted DNA-binding transcriptional regulator AlpA